MEEQIFPSSLSTESTEDIEEERRLAYVGITRAKQRLFLTNARSRVLFGSTKYNMPSRFLDEIPSGLVKLEGTGLRSALPNNGVQHREFQPATVDRGFSASRDIKVKPPKTAPNANKYKAGDTVGHKTFGTGVILSIQPMGNDLLLEIAFDKAGTKKIMANYANLTTE